MPKSSSTESEVPAPLNEAIAAGLAAVTAAARDLGAVGEPVACRDVGRVFDTAIEHGAPIWNRGSQVGCASIYLRAARALLEKLRTPERPPALLPGDVDEVLNDLAIVAKAAPVATPEIANKLGWALRGIFDRFHSARGIENIDQLIDATRAAGGAVDVDLVGLCLTVALSHGNLLHEVDALDACAVLHDHTARRVLRLLAEAEKTDGPLTPGLVRVRRELAPIVANYPRITSANAPTLAWELYNAFLKIVKLAPEVSNRQATREYQGFISYRRAGGADAARAVRAYLQLRGLNTFLDVDELNAGEFGPRLLREIEQAPCFLLILSPGSLDRCEQTNDWVRLEIAHAIQKQRKIIPILMNGFQFPPAASLPPDIRALVGYNAVPYTHEFFDAVIDRIERYMR